MPQLEEHCNGIAEVMGSNPALRPECFAQLLKLCVQLR